MKAKALGIAMIAATIAAPRQVGGQTMALVPTGSTVATTVNFQLQLNLTNLSPDLERVRLVCAVQSPAAYMWTPPGTTGPSDIVARFPGAELYAAQGKAVGILSVSFPIATVYLAPDAVGKQASYTCMLYGFSTSLQRWDVLSDQQTTAAFRITPAATPIQGTFVW